MPARLLLAIAALLPFFLMAQPATIPTTNGRQSMQPASSATMLQTIKTKALWQGRYGWLAKFNTVPTGQQKAQWEKEGIVFHSKLDAQTYFISTTEAPATDWLIQHQITGVAIPDPTLKLEKNLAAGKYPTEARDAAGLLTLLVAIQPKTPLAPVKEWLRQNGFTVENSSFENTTGILTIHASTNDIEKLAQLPVSMYIQPIRKDKALNEKVRFFSHANLAQATLANGGYNLNGNGITIGVGDLGDGTQHPDLTDRVSNYTIGISERHGAHVTGIAAGAGLLQPDRKGMAPLAKVITQFFSGIWKNASQYFQDFGMVVTNNSYGNTVDDCSSFGTYDLYSQILDQQATDLPAMLHVFASGNSGDYSCAPYPVRYHTVLGGYQSAKNVITVGRTDHDFKASGSSSRGPVADGRLKPEIMSLGAVQSCNEAAGYYQEWGTSQAAPGITGGVALLYEKYRLLFGGANPNGALIKTVLLNGARDIEQPGPDYQTGYGYMHLGNSLRMLENHQYLTASLATGQQKDTVIAVVAGKAQLKVLLYWHDLPANTLAASTLVNDLDLEVVLPNGTTVVYPKKLQTTPGNGVVLPATEGTDHINNSEQVVIETPIAGNYTIRVKGYDVTGSQRFYVAYDYPEKGVFIRTPLKGDSWARSAADEWVVEGVAISWDDEGTASGDTYTLEYSLNNGSSWTTIPADPLVPAVPLALKDTARWYGWRPPMGTATNQAMVRISKNNTSYTSTSPVFSILERPLGVSISKPCEGYLTISWQAVTGATDYEVIMKKGPQMVGVTTTNSLSYTLSGLNKDSIYYVGVRARKDGIAGRYTQIYGQQPNSGACTDNASNGDLKLDSITAPLTGRQFTSTALTANESLRVRVKNLDNAPLAIGSFTVKYKLDNGLFISAANTSTVAANGSYEHIFNGLDLSSAGTHTITAVVTNTAATDNTPQNDSFTLVVKNLTNPIITPITNLSGTFKDGFETATAASYQQNITGMQGLDRWDYNTNSQYGRARSFVTSDIAYAGTKAITLDVTRQQNATNNNLIGTLNLVNNTTADEVRLDFQFKHHGPVQQAGPQNKVWIRGNDAAAWIEAYDLGANQTDQAGVWKVSKSLELNDLLSAAGQTFSSSAQVRFGQNAELGMADNTNLAGYSFDDVRVYLAQNDLQMISLNEPAINSCALNNAVTVKTTIRNSMQAAASGVQVSYTINGGSPITETIAASIPGNSSYNYEFVTKANLSAYGVYNIVARVIYTNDNVPQNDTISSSVYNLPIISSFPYLQDFENDNGHFYASGKNVSWQWGQPKSVHIDTAASGTNAWKTSLQLGYNDLEKSYLNLPCFDVSALNNPTLSFSLAYDIEDCSPFSSFCDGAWLEYSTDGNTWTKLGLANQGTSWYDNSTYNVWMKRQQYHWHAATISLPKASNLRLRFAMETDVATGYEGIAIDDIHIYDLAEPMYTAIGTSNAVVHAVSGTAPIHFSDAGKLIATLYPNGNNLGSTEVKAYIYNGAVRNHKNQQYYGNRNITIKPSTNPGSTVGVRMYFTNKEVDSLRLANSCATCTQPKDYTHLGITQYTDLDKSKEDGSLANNTSGLNQYIFGGDIRLVPYDSGYYAQFDVSHFSEFWLNDGRDSNIPLPGKWLNFIASKQNNGNTAQLVWDIANETNVSHYEVQVATSLDAANSNQFETIAKVDAKNISPANYLYLDERNGKQGNYYYRIVQADKDGSLFYSPIRMLYFGSTNLDITTRPNPVKDQLMVAIQSDESKQLQIRILNAIGQLVHTQQWNINAGSSQLIIPINRLAISKGIYTIGVSDGKTWWHGKFVKE